MKTTKQVVKFKTSNGKVLWKSNNSTSNYTFSNPKNMGNTTRSFLRYIISCQLIDIKPTRKGWYKYVGRQMTKGNLCTFFSSIVRSGIVQKHSEWNGDYNETWFSIGENFHQYLNGNLDRWKYYSQGEWDILPTK